MPYVLTVASMDSATGDHAFVAIRAPYGLWSDSTRLMRLQVATFHHAAGDTSAENVNIGSIFVRSNLKARNAMGSKAVSGSIIAHLTPSSPSDIVPITLPPTPLSVIVDAPQDGQVLEFELINPQTGARLDAANPWAATINLYPILESNEVY